MVDRLQAKLGLELRQRAQRDQAVVRAVGFDVKLAQVLGAGAIGIRHFKDDLILIVRLLDQVDVILRISRAEQALDFGRGNAVEAGAFAVDLDIDVRGVAEEVRARRGGEAFVASQFFAQLIGRGVNFFGVDAADDVAVAAEGAARAADVDLQNGRWIERRENAGDNADLAPQLLRDLVDRGPLRPRFQKEDSEDAGTNRRGRCPRR